MIKKGKIKYDNNYWTKVNSTTWSNYYNFFDIIRHDFGAYSVLHMCNTGKMSLTSNDSGATFTKGELQPTKYLGSEIEYIDIPEDEIDAFIKSKLDPLGKNKIITWEEPMHEVA